jgi:hypothetical protein
MSTVGLDKALLCLCKGMGILRGRHCLGAGFIEGLFGYVWRRRLSIDMFGG